MRVDNQALRKYHSHLHPTQCPSVIAPYHYALRALEQQQIVRVMGKLSDADRNSLAKVIRGILGE